MAVIFLFYFLEIKPTEHIYPTSFSTSSKPSCFLRQTPLICSRFSQFSASFLSPSFLLLASLRHVLQAPRSNPRQMPKQKREAASLPSQASENVFSSVTELVGGEGWNTSGVASYWEAQLVCMNVCVCVSCPLSCSYVSMATEQMM